MAAIDCARVSESIRLGLVAATYKMTQRMFVDPAVRAEYEEWLAKRKAAEKAAK